MAITNLQAGDLLLSGKLISLMASIATVLVTYLLWEMLESKEVAFLAAGLVAVNEFEWYYSIHVYRDSLFLFFCTLSFLLLFKVREDSSQLPYLGAVLGLATLTRGEGYFLALSLALTYCYWMRDYITGEKSWRDGEVGYIIYSILNFVFLTFPWQIYTAVTSKTLIPSIYSHEVSRFGHVGLSWFISVVGLVTLPLFILSLGGVYLSLKEKEKYLPFYLFIVFYSLLHMWFFLAMQRYALPLLPIIIGWASMAILYVIYKAFSFNTGMKLVIITLLILISFNHSFSVMSQNESQGDMFEVVEDAMMWFDTNSEEEAKIVVGSETVYGYYTNRQLILHDEVTYAIVKSKKELSKTLLKPLFILYLVFNDIHYFIAYDSTTPWYYKITKSFADSFNHHELYLWGIKTKLTPLKKFEKNNQTVYLYRVDWE